jgi:hypothetical protein
LEDAYTNLLEDYLHKEKIERNRKALEEVDWFYRLGFFLQVF